jgi:GT2 family glycosyltransferase
MDLIVSIVTYNNSSIIEKTVRSILNNTYNLNYKIIVHDNKSTDNTLEVIKNLDSNNIEIIDSKTNYGFGYGHNRVVEHYSAKYYLIYNPDVILSNNVLKNLYDFMEQKKDIGMVIPKILYSNGEIQYLCKQNPTVFDLFFRRFIPENIKFLFKKRNDWYEMRDTGYDKVFEIPYATGCFMFFRSSILKQIKGFDENFFMYLEDADITRRVNKISKCVFYPYSSVEHLWNRGSHKSLKLTWINIKSVFYYFNKWGWDFW